ncbi:unnamed protein product, partial [Prorocentrum cordatum]
MMRSSRRRVVARLCALQLERVAWSCNVHCRRDSEKSWSAASPIQLRYLRVQAFLVRGFDDRGSLWSSSHTECIECRSAHPDVHVAACDCKAGQIRHTGCQSRATRRSRRQAAQKRAVDERVEHTCLSELWDVEASTRTACRQMLSLARLYIVVDLAGSSGSERQAIGQGAAKFVERLTFDCSFLPSLRRVTVGERGAMKLDDLELSRAALPPELSGLDAL